MPLNVPDLATEELMSIDSALAVYKRVGAMKVCYCQCNQRAVFGHVWLILPRVLELEASLGAEQWGYIGDFAT